MSDAEERHKQLRANYEQAAKNEEDDVRAAKAAGDLVLARRVSKNVRKARVALADALVAGLRANSGAIEEAYGELSEANGSVETARREGKSIADLFNLISGATKSATKLANALAVGEA